jgi:hypothetical protein
MRSEPQRRDAAIDFVRGAGILMIGVDHLAYLAEKLAGPGFVNPFITWLRIGWSSAAEFFVFFSGYLIGAVYLKTLETHGPWMTWARAAQRSWHIYVVNLLTLCTVFALMHMSTFSDVALLRITDMELLFGAGAAEQLAAFLGLQFAPMFFEILGLYVVLLLIAPAILMVARLSSWLVVAVSFGAWLVVQLHLGKDITPALAATQSFNPLAWQLVFVLGMLAGMHRTFDWLRQHFSRRHLIIATGGLLLLALIVKTLARFDSALPILGNFKVPDAEKLNLGPLQLMHFLISVIFVMQIVPRSDAAQRQLPFKAVTAVGRRSLECFCLSTIIVYAMVGFLAQTNSFDVISMLVGGAIIVVALCAAAPAIEWVDKKPWRGQKRPRAEATSAAELSGQLSARNVP